MATRIHKYIEQRNIKKNTKLWNYSIQNTRGVRCVYMIRFENIVIANLKTLVNGIVLLNSDKKNVKEKKEEG